MSSNPTINLTVTLDPRAGSTEIRIPTTLYAGLGCVDTVTGENITFAKLYFASNIKHFKGTSLFAAEPSKLREVYFDGTAEDWLNIDFEGPASNPLFGGGNLYFKNPRTNKYDLVTQFVLADASHSAENDPIQVPAYSLYDCRSLKKLVLVNAPGPGSGKLATCLSQLYHEQKRGINAGYAKFETFPVWNLDLKHPVNLAYEAATADLKDVNMIDSFHLEKYNIKAVNYNRDLSVFPILKTILSKITNKDIYHSPTDMGVNTISKCIIDNDIVEEAAKKEIVRRYYQELSNYKTGLVDIDIPNNIKVLMNQININNNILTTIEPALEKHKKENKPVIALKLPNNEIITGKESNLLSAPSALIINAIKTLSKIPDNINLLSPNILEPILKLRKQNTPLQLQEVMIALSICSVTNPTIENALTYLKDLKNCEAHATYIITNGDKKSLNNLGIRLTCEPNFHSDNLFYN
jgi:uncharacterized protein (UPF0371 family)